MELEIVLSEEPKLAALTNAIHLAEENNCTFGGAGKEFFLSGEGVDMWKIAATILAALTGTMIVITES